MNHEHEYLRQLARQVREIADNPIMKVRRQLWRDHNALRSKQPLVLCYPEGAWSEILPGSALQCVDPVLRGWERALRTKIWWWHHLNDDHWVEPFIDVGWRIEMGSYGVDIPMTHGDNRGSYVWEAPLHDLEAELPKLHFRSLRVDREGSRQDFALAQEIFGNVLTPRRRANLWWTVGLTWEAAKLVGLENLMFLMCDQPEQVHRLMAFLRDEHMHFIQWCEEEGVLTENTGPEYVGSGGIGCSDELGGDGQRLQDRWGFAESQETVGISPAMFEEFVLPYQVPLLEKFGLNCYGCCEGLEGRIDAVLQQVPRLRRVSIAPSANQEILAEKLAGKYIFSRKPYPAHVCVGFNEKAAREDLRHTLTVARGQPLELILKDTHTVQNQPERLTRWVKMAREEIDQAR